MISGSLRRQQLKWDLKEWRNQTFNAKMFSHSQRCILRTGVFLLYVMPLVCEGDILNWPRNQWGNIVTWPLSIALEPPVRSDIKPLIAGWLGGAGRSWEELGWHSDASVSTTISLQYGSVSLFKWEAWCMWGLVVSYAFVTLWSKEFWQLTSCSYRSFKKFWPLHIVQ